MLRHRGLLNKQWPTENQTRVSYIERFNEYVRHNSAQIGFRLFDFVTYVGHFYLLVWISGVPICRLLRQANQNGSKCSVSIEPTLGRGLAQLKMACIR